jgi:hypothetical protein
MKPETVEAPKAPYSFFPAKLGGEGMGVHNNAVDMIWDVIESEWRIVKIHSTFLNNYYYTRPIPPGEGFKIVGEDELPNYEDMELTYDGIYWFPVKPGFTVPLKELIRDSNILAIRRPVAVKQPSELNWVYCIRCQSLVEQGEKYCKPCTQVLLNETEVGGSKRGKTNAGVLCDTEDGPCSCGAWHHKDEKSDNLTQENLDTQAKVLEEMDKHILKDGDKKCDHATAGATIPASIKTNVIAGEQSQAVGSSPAPGETKGARVCIVCGYNDGDPWRECVGGIITHTYNTEQPISKGPQFPELFTCSVCHVESNDVVQVCKGCNKPAWLPVSQCDLKPCEPFRSYDPSGIEDGGVVLHEDGFVDPQVWAASTSHTHFMRCTGIYQIPKPPEPEKVEDEFDEWRSKTTIKFLTCATDDAVKDYIKWAAITHTKGGGK